VKIRYADAVGTYRLVITADLLDFIDRAIVAPSLPVERRRARDAALHEAEGSELAITGDGCVASRAHGIELFRTVVERPEADVDELTIYKLAARVTLEWIDHDTVVARQAAKPALLFRRVLVRPDEGS
jgi:hypothetical protein